MSSSFGRSSLAPAVLVLVATQSPSAMAQQEGRWEQALEAFPERGDLRIEERPGSVLAWEGTRLLRRRGGMEVEIECLDGAGTGLLRDLALDPAGLVFIAAERGLFVLSPEVEVLARVPLSEGAPRGSPRSVVVDARRRLWMATDEEIGVIDPCFGWGRTLARENGMPGDPPFRLAAGRDGSLLVETSQGVHRYLPDSGPGPAVTSITIAGRDWTQGQRVTGRSGDPLALAAKGWANGGATFRYRFDASHVWRELEPTPIEHIPPGSHTLDVIAIDCDLRRSTPRRMTVDYALPPQYEQALVVRVAILLVALVTAFFLWRARHSGHDRNKWVRAPVSAGLAIAVGLQLVAGIVPHAKGWPFIGFSMYTYTYQEGSIIYDGRLVGIDADGSVRKLDLRGIVPFADERWQVLWPIIDGGAAFSREWIARYNELRPAERLVGLQVRADRRQLTERGAVRIAPLVLSSYVEDSEGGGR